MKEYVLSLKEKTTQDWFSYLQIARNSYICVIFFRANLLNIIFDDLIWYMITRL